MTDDDAKRLAALKEVFKRHDENDDRRWLLSLVDRLQRERDEARQQRNDLLARIHRDGGHYTGRVGIEQSMEDAHEKVATAYGERDEARAEVERLRGDMKTIVFRTHSLRNGDEILMECRDTARRALTPTPEQEDAGA